MCQKIYNRKVKKKAAAQESSELNQDHFCRVPREFTLVITKFPSWPYSKSVTPGLFPKQSNNGTVPLGLQFTTVPLCSGCNPGKWFTQAILGSSLVSHLGWNVPCCSHLYHTRAPGRLREHLMVQLVQLGDPSPLSRVHQGLSGDSEISEQGQGGVGDTHHHIITFRFGKV